MPKDGSRGPDLAVLPEAGALEARQPGSRLLRVSITSKFSMRLV